MNDSIHSSCATAVAERPASAKRPTILVIDDDPGVSRALIRCLSHYDVAVLRAHHGAHGLWLAKTEGPDVIITDLRMPQGGGQHVVECLKRRPDTRGIPIIVLTGLYHDGLERQMRQLGVDEYFTKPVALDDLCYAVRRFVELRESAPEE
jgi:CheY-like chemotaxis protein